MKKHLWLKSESLLLQLFAEGDPATAGGGEPAATVAGLENQNTAQEPAKATEPKKDELKYTDADIDRIVKGKKAEWQKALEKERAAAEAEKAEAAKLAEMNAQEKAEYALKQEQEKHAATLKELDELKRKDTLSEMTKTARKMLADSGISASDDILTLLVSTDAEQTKAAIDAYTKAYTQAVEKGVEDRLKGNTPTVGSGKQTPLSEVEKRIKKYE